MGQSAPTYGAVCLASYWPKSKSAEGLGNKSVHACYALWRVSCASYGDYGGVTKALETDDGNRCDLLGLKLPRHVLSRVSPHSPRRVFFFSFLEGPP